MRTVKAWAAPSATEPLTATTIERRDVGPNDVLIEIAYAGICHSDIHTARAEWGDVPYPIVVGHEIAGTVAEVGSEVTKHAVGDRVGVGCLVNSCGECDACRAGHEQYCPDAIGTYNATDRDGMITQGGYSTHVVVDADFALKIPEGIELDVAAPLLCAGITTWTPLRRWGAGPGTKVAVVGDILHSRVARSNVHLLDRLGADVHLVVVKPYAVADLLAQVRDYLGPGSVVVSLALGVSLADLAAGMYVLDASHSEVGFVARHAMVTKVRGYFRELEGTITVADDFTASSASATMQVASVDTGSADRDGHLKSADFFDAENTPEITFVSTGIKDVKGDEFTLVGDLTIKGITKPVELEAEFNGAATDPFGNARIGFSAETEVEREDWGLTWNAALETGGVLVSKKITLTLDISAIKQA